MKADRRRIVDGAVERMLMRILHETKKDIVVEYVRYVGLQKRSVWALPT